MGRTHLLGLVTGTLVLVTTTASAGAATITVNSTFDGGGCSLRAAIAAVDAPGASGGSCTPAAFGANTIVLPAGTYRLGGQFASGQGQLEISSTVTALTITGAGEGATTIDASGLGDRVLQVDGGAAATIRDLTITGGRAKDGAAGGAAAANGADGAGGGAILNGGALSLIDVAVDNSHAGNGGDGVLGAANASGAGGTGGNGGNGGPGGGVLNTGGLVITGSTFSGDGAGRGGAGGAGGQGSTSGGGGGTGGGGGAGGGVANLGGSLSVGGTTFRGDISGDGGPGGAGGAGASGAGGNAGGGGGARGGGGLYDSGGTVAAANTTFASDAAGSGGAGGAGGGSSAGAGGNGSSGGAAGAGGGVLTDTATSVDIGSVTAAGNSVGGPGTAGPAGAGTPAGTTGAAGSSAAGGGLAGAGTSLPIRNSLLARNKGGNCNGTVVDAGHNLSFGDTSCPARFLAGDPDLGPIEDNGGPSQTISLQTGSAAIDAVPPSGAGCPTGDQRGVPRPSGSGCDIGAYEVAGPTANNGPATPVTSLNAVLNALVTPNAGAATAAFRYGTTTKYGTNTNPVTVSGVTPQPVTVGIGQLQPATTYHYQIVIVAMDGSAISQDRTFTTLAPPRIDGLAFTPTTFRAVAGGPTLVAAGTAPATIRYRDTTASRTAFSVFRTLRGVTRGARCVAPPRRGAGRHGCVRFVRIGGFTATDEVGRNQLHFSARINGRKLAPGSYVLRATPHSQGLTGPTASAQFKIRP